jgi:hypothetical protein
VTLLPSHRLRIWVAGIGIGAALLAISFIYGEGYQIVNALFDGQVEMLASGMQLQSLELNGWMLIDF